MTTRRLRILCAVLVPLATTASSMAEPIGHPTPCPCMADGACIPDRATWGYHKTQWRLWPGTTLDQGASTEATAVGSGQVRDTAKPDPRSEDRLAPPKVEALDPQPAEKPPADDSNFELPEIDAPAAEENGDAQRGPLDIPPPDFIRRPDALPFDKPTDDGTGQPSDQPSLPFGQPPAAPQETPQPPADLFPSNMKRRPAAPAVADDVPPALPFGIERNTRPARPRATNADFVLQASASRPSDIRRPTVSRIPTTASRQHVEQAAFNHIGDTPPQLPPGLFGSR